MRTIIFGIIGMLFTLNSVAYAPTPEDVRLEIIKSIETAAQKANVDTDLALAIAQHESDFNPRAMTYEPKYKTYSVGLFQMLLPTARAMGFHGPVKELQRPEVNIRLGIQHLSECTDRFGESVDEIACCHNAGTAVKVSHCKKKGIRDYVNRVMIVYRSWRIKRSVSSSTFNTVALNE